ncbi:MAG: lytic transglycosylase [Alteromonadaceae bacterium]|nr:MAG: lytic transglycosylase [Alteromonadaceae bacterium]
MALLSVLLSGCNTLPTFLTGGEREAKPETALSEEAPREALALNQASAFDPECQVDPEQYKDFAPLAPLDLWDRIRADYRLIDTVDNRRVLSELNWFKRHPKYLDRVAKRGERYLYYIVEQIEARGMPMEIALLPIVESAFDPFAYSHSRASGMWQIIPGTGKMLGLKQNWWYDGRRDVTASTDAALTYLQSLHKRFSGDWLLALAAYNSGGGNVSKAIRRNKKAGKPTDFWNLKLPKETQTYVPRLLALSRLIARADEFKLSLHSIPNTPYFASIETQSQIDLAQAAALANIDMDILYHLNPAFNRWATDPRGPHKLLLPIAVADEFKTKLAAVPQKERVTWDRYTIKSGDALSTIAKHYKISVKSLQAINNLRSSRIREGKTLMVPVATAPAQHYSYSATQRLEKRYASSAKKEKGQHLNYEVKSGDSFWTISRRHKVSVRKLAKWNNMAPKDPLRIGQKLKIWTKNKTLMTSVSSAPPSKKGVIRKLSYKVRNGDSLARIANKFQLSIANILEWNKLKRDKYLQPGQRLTLFVDVTKVKS